MIRRQTPISMRDAGRQPGNGEHAGSDATVGHNAVTVNDDATRIVRAYFSAFHAHDRAAAERLLSEDFRFTSPFDDRIDKAAYFERCWPHAQQFRAFEIETLCGTDGEAFVRYECAIESGPKFRNLEYFRIEDGRIKEVEVYFGSLPEEGSAQ